MDPFQEVEKFDDQQLLLALKFLRRELHKQHGEDLIVHETIMQLMVDELVKRGVYPEKTSIQDSSHLEMVKSYGESWHVWKHPLQCAHCQADLRSKQGPPFKREIGQYDRLKDRITHFTCPDCGKTINPAAN